MLLLATDLYNVMFVATVSVAAVGPKNYVRIVDLDANVGVAPSVYGILPYPGAESGQGGVPAWVHRHADGGGQGAVQQRQDAHQDGRLGRVHA